MNPSPQGEALGARSRWADVAGYAWVDLVVRVELAAEADYPHALPDCQIAYADASRGVDKYLHRVECPAPG
jgi:hypothetical protein